MAAIVLTRNMQLASKWNVASGNKNLLRKNYVMYGAVLTDLLCVFF